MAYPREVVFKCNNCGFIFIKPVGDVLFFGENIQKCPICGGMATPCDFSELGKYVEKILEFFKGKK
jgi:rubrerythrin